jgi:hypothetical protein
MGVFASGVAFMVYLSLPSTLRLKWIRDKNHNREMEGATIICGDVAPRSYANEERLRSRG